MSPIDHLIVTVIGARRARAEERRPAPQQAGRRGPKSPPGRRSGTA
ncbi:hypothetical protein ACWEF6_09055 [Amycolatopsis sp. NPDC004772]